MVVAVSRWEECCFVSIGGHTTGAGDIYRLFFFFTGWEKRANIQMTALAERISGDPHDFDFPFDVQLRNENGFVLNASYWLAAHIVSRKDSSIALLRYTEAEIPNAMLVRVEAVLHEQEFCGGGKTEADPF